MRRESGINPKVYSWWYRNRKVRNRSRASTHITLSDFPWRRYQAAREKKRANIASTAQRAVEWRGRLFIPLFSRPRRVECEPEFVQLPRQANQERADGSGLDQNEAQTMAGGLSYICIQPLSPHRHLRPQEKPWISLLRQRRDRRVHAVNLITTVKAQTSVHCSCSSTNHVRSNPHTPSLALSPCLRTTWPTLPANIPDSTNPPPCSLRRGSRSFSNQQRPLPPMVPLPLLLL